MSEKPSPAQPPATADGSTGTPPSRAPFVISVVGAVLAAGAALAWCAGTGSPPEGAAVVVDAGPPVEVVGDQPSLSAGSDVIVYWRAISGDDASATTVPYEHSFEITVSAAGDGTGAITGEQLFTRLGHIPDGKVLKAWVRMVVPKAAPQGGSAVVVTESDAEQLGQYVRVDAKGRAVLFVDVQLGPRPEDPEVEQEGDPQPTP